MGLTLSGTVIDVETRTVNPPNGATWSAFESTELRVFTGRSVEYARVGRDFAGQLPARDEVVELEVSCSAYVNKFGQARVQYTATGVRLPEKV